MKPFDIGITFAHNLLVNIIKYKKWNIQFTKNIGICCARIWNGNGKRCTRKREFGTDFCKIHNSFNVNNRYTTNGIVRGRKYKGKEIKYFVKQKWEINGRYDKPFVAKDIYGNIIWQGKKAFFFKETDKNEEINKNKLFEFNIISKNKFKDIMFANSMLKSTKSSTIYKKQKLEDLFDKKLALVDWWTSSPKVLIIDNKTKAKFEVVLEKLKDDDGYRLLQKNKQSVGKAVPWIDKTNEIPEDFKHRNIVQDPDTFGIPLYIYKLSNGSELYHALPKNKYTQYKYDEVNNFMKPTNEIKIKF